MKSGLPELVSRVKDVMVFKCYTISSQLTCGVRWWWWCICRFWIIPVIDGSKCK